MLGQRGKRTETAQAPALRGSGRSVLRIAAAVTALAALSLGAGGSSSSNAATTQDAAPTQTQTVTKTETVTAPAKTTTVTAPTQTNTVVKTETTTAAPSTSTTAGHPGAVAAGAAAARSQQPESEEGGLPGWAWGLIGLAVGAAVIGAIWSYRNKHNPQTRPPGGPAGQAPTQGDPPRGM